jgi:hypothetical protein
MGSDLVANMGLYDPVNGWAYGNDSNPTAGEYIATRVDLQGVSTGELQALKDRLTTTKVKFAANGFNGITPDDLTGDSLFSAILTYFATTQLERQMNSRLADIVEYNMPSYGSSLVGAHVTYWFDIPINVSFPGIIMDVGYYATNLVAKDNDVDRALSYVQNSGMQLSVYEHLIPEKLFSDPTTTLQGVSAVKALALAFQQGQKIYVLSAENSGAVLPILNISESVKQEIINVVAAGKLVTVHQSNITINTWTGVGYIISDPVTGAGAYKISGGANGGALNFTIHVAQQPSLLLPPCGVSFLETMINNFLITNASIPGIAFPTGAGLVTAKIVGDAVGGQTFLTAIKLSIKNSTFLLGNLRAALIVSSINFLLMSLVFETGICVGSAIGATFCRNG